MAGFLVCAIAVPEAFDSGGVAFGIGYLIVVIVHAGLYAQAYGPAALRFVPLNLLGALCVLIGGLVPIPARYVLWAVPIGLQYLASVRTRTSDETTRAGFDLHVPHFVERHGLLLLIAIGESVVAIGSGIGAIPLDLGVFIAALLGLALAAALWWSYFERDEARAEASLKRGTLLQRTGMALNGYFYAYIPMLLGIVALSAGVRLTIGRLGTRLEPGPALLVGGGVALYLAGSAAFRRALGIGGILDRLAAAAVAVACVLVGTGVAAGAELVALVALLMAMLALEARQATD
jgi:low temperature requirement protein LtrA